VANGMSVGADGATGPLLKVGDVSQMKVTVLVAESYLPFIHQGQVATATFPGLPGITETASVTAISSTPSGVAADATGQASYAVEFMLAGTDPNLRPGMSAQLNIVLQSAGDSLIVPSKAIWREIGEDGTPHYFVNVVDDSGDLRRCEISVIAQNNEEAAIWGDIAEGDIVRVNN
jgi:HlyD family secretion protein